MRDGKIVEYSILNISASPHPDGVYKDVLTQVALNPINYWGDHFATISEPVEDEKGFYRGRIVSWVEIDKSQPAVHKDKLEEVDFDQLNFRIPDNIGFNSKTFLYVFRERDHLMFIETKNELGQSLSTSRTRRIMQMLMSQPILGKGAPLIEVTVIPEEDAVKRILSLPKLKRLRIHIVRPNADDLDVQKVLDRLQRQGIRSDDRVLVASSENEGIIPDEETKLEAEVAEFNGFVQGVGYEEDGTRVDLSTKEYPRTIKKRVGQLGSSFAEIMAVAKETVLRQPRA